MKEEEERIMVHRSVDLNSESIEQKVHDKARKKLPHITVTIRLLSFVEEEFDTDDITVAQFEGKYPRLLGFFKGPLTNHYHHQHIDLMDALQPDVSKLKQTLFPSGRCGEHMGGFCFDVDGNNWCYSNHSETVPASMDHLCHMNRWINFIKHIIENNNSQLYHFDFDMYGESFELVVDHRGQLEGTIELRHLGLMRCRQSDETWMEADEFDPLFNPAPVTIDLKQFCGEMLRELTLFFKLMTTAFSSGVILPNSIDHFEEDTLNEVKEVIDILRLYNVTASPCTFTKCSQQ